MLHLLGLFGVGIVILYWTKRKLATPLKTSLYSRVKGIFPIAQLVHHFLDQLKTNPIVGISTSNPHLALWWKNQSETRLAGLEWMLTLWLSHFAGGPYNFQSSQSTSCLSVLGVEKSHCHFHIQPNEFEAFAQEMRKSLETLKISNPEKQEFLVGLLGHKFEIVACPGVDDILPVCLKPKPLI